MLWKILEFLGRKKNRFGKIEHSERLETRAILETLDLRLDTSDTDYISDFVAQQMSIVQFFSMVFIKQCSMECGSLSLTAAFSFK